VIDARGRDATNEQRWLRKAATGGVVGPILFVLGVIVAGTMYDGYSHVGQKISELGGDGAENAIVQNANFSLLGLLVLGFAWALARVCGPPLTGPALIALFALSSCMANALLPCDPGCEGESTVGMLHIVTGLLGFLAALLGMLVLARHWRDDAEWSAHARFTKGALLAAVVGLVCFVVTQAAGAPKYSGLAQRSFVSVLLVWITVTALHLVRTINSTDQGSVGRSLVEQRQVAPTDGASRLATFVE
jgi:hypothetical membrane protein